MQLIDDVFRVLFARYRRKLSEGKLESAWRRASNEVTGFLVLPSATAMIVALELTHWITQTQLTDWSLSGWQLAAGGAWLVIAMLLERRFKKFLHSEPAPVAQETREEKRRVQLFRAAGIAVFVLACVAAVIKNEMRN